MDHRIDQTKELIRKQQVKPHPIRITRNHNHQNPAKTKRPAEGDWA